MHLVKAEFWMAKLVDGALIKQGIIKVIKTEKPPTLKLANNF